MIQSVDAGEDAHAAPSATSTLRTRLSTVASLLSALRGSGGDTRQVAVLEALRLVLLMK